ncbi:MAG TPA: 50S ribosomal protein L11 methyltransferase [Thermomicrobiales bacterium]|nr:50S ribosomal protein L11 methyltransferase [Thermomicrobiales bacterium]
MSEQDAATGRWIELSVEVDHEAVEPVVELFSRYGYNEGVVIEEPFTQDRDGDNVRVDITRPFRIRTFIPQENFDAAALEAIRTGIWYLGHLRGTGELTVETRNEEDWANAWKAHYVPVRVGTRVVVRPPWQEYDPVEGDVVVLLDPGMAFGTGTHPTTQIALRLLETLDLDGRSLLDVGTGSGIIAIAAAKLGASTIEGVDIDEVSVRQAVANVALNDVVETVTIWKSNMAPDAAPIRSYDIVVANIIARVLIEIADQIVPAVGPDGTMVLSGIIDSKESGVLETYTSLGFEMIARQQIEDWIGHIWQRAPVNAS